MGLQKHGVEAAEEQIDRFIERRAQENAAERERQELYAESVRRYYDKRRRANRQAWVRFHEHMCEQFLALADEHRRKSEKVLEAVEQLPKEGEGGRP